MVRSVIFRNNDHNESELITPSDQYLQHWLPNVPDYKILETGETKMLARPWITSHSVRNMILTLIIKQQQGWRHVEKLKKLKVYVTESADIPTEAKGKQEGEVMLWATVQKEKKLMKVPIKEELKLQDAVEQIKKKGIDDI